MGRKGYGLWKHEGIRERKERNVELENVASCASFEMFQINM
jgi:hypothetical protein